MLRWRTHFTQTNHFCLQSFISSRKCNLSGNQKLTKLVGWDTLPLWLDPPPCWNIVPTFKLFLLLMDSLTITLSSFINNYTVRHTRVSIEFGSKTQQIIYAPPIGGSCSLSEHARGVCLSPHQHKWKCTGEHVCKVTF